MNSPVRHISFLTASSFILASMIGTGVFTSLGFQLIKIQSIFPLLMLWVIGGILSLCGALSYGELGSALPRSGGEYHLLSHILHPSIGFAAGVVSATVGFSAPSVLAAMALGSYLKAVFPFFNQTIVAIIVIVLFHFIHMKSVRWGTFFQNITTLVKIALIFIFIFFGLFIDQPQSISIMPKTGDASILLSSGFANGLVWITYAYAGWNSVIYIAGEIKHPQNNIHRSMLFSTGMVMGLYLLLNYIFLYTASIEDMVGKVEIGYISGIMIFGHIGYNIIGFGIALLLLSTVSSYIYIGPRIMQTMGQDYEFLSFLNNKNKDNIPVTAFFIQLLISFGFIVTSSFEQVLMYAGITLIITTTLTVISLFVLRYKEPSLNRPYKVWGYPFTPLLFLAANIWILYYSFQESMFESIIGIGIIVISILFYYIFNRKYNFV